MAERRRPRRGRLRGRDGGRAAAPPPALRAAPRDRARGRRARGWTTVHPRTRVPLELEPYDPADAGRRRDRRLPARRRRAGRGGAAGARRARGRPVGRLPPARPATYSEWYGEHGAPELFGDAVYGLPELHRDEIRGADLVANPGCYPTAAILALAPLARAGLLGDVVIDAKSGVSGAGREPTPRQALRDRRRERHAVQGRRPPPHGRRSSRSSAARAITFIPHLVPLSHGELVSCYVTPARAGRRTRRSTATPTRDEPWVEVVDRPARHAGGARDELLPHLAARRRAHGAPDRVRHDRQPLEGHLVAGRPEPQPDVRLRRDGGAC